MRRGHCRNCGWTIKWGLYCSDCMRMVGKTVLVVVVEEFVRYLWRVL